MIRQLAIDVPNQDLTSNPNPSILTSIHHVRLCLGQACEFEVLREGLPLKLGRVPRIDSFKLPLVSSHELRGRFYK